MPIGFPEMASRPAEDLNAAPAWMAFQDAARRYRDDESWRARIDVGDAEAISALTRDVGLDVVSGTAIRVSVNDEETFHFILPPDPNVDLADENLYGVVGGARASSMSSISSASTLACSCMPSTCGSALCGGTAI